MTKLKRAKKQPKKQPKKKEYKAKQITVLDGLTPVRKRPAMYIGSLGPDGLHHLIWEVVDNSIDEAMVGHCDEITVELLPKNQVRITDNGRGIPVDKHKPTGKSALEVVMTKLHAGAKFDRSAYKVAGGLHGVGVSVVNALSEYLKAEVKRNNKLYLQEYKRGKPLRKVRPVGKAEGTGTIITFQPDPGIFPEIKFNWEKILTHLRQQAYLTRGVRIKVYDRREETPRQYEFYFEGGIKSYVKYLNRTNAPKHPNIFYVMKEQEGVMTEMALQYTDDFKENVLTFANNIYTLEGGMHLAGFRSALTRTLNSYARKQNYLKEKDVNLAGEDVREGLTAIISVKVKDPQFEGQTKSKLGNTEVRTVVEAIFSDTFEQFLEKHPRDAEAICGKAILSAKARQAAKVARETVIRKGVLEGMALPGKLADCSSRNPEESELFICEGDSAGGSGKQGRDRHFQAILPLRGKILNVERARLDKILANNELRALITALGTNIGEQFDIEKLRYHRIIIMTDADTDGSHIRTLLLTFFYRYFPELIKKGHIYIAQPPLYRIQRGKEVRYAYTDGEKEKILKEKIRGKKKKEVVKKEVTAGFAVKEIGAKEEAASEEEGAVPGTGVKANIQRYKGLGEMNPPELWTTTMDPANRILKKVTIGDAQEADEIFEVLMGREVEPRKRFIQTHAKMVENLDI